MTVQRNRRGEARLGYLFVSPYFLVFGAFGLFPIAFTLWVSLHDWALLGGHTWSGLDNYGKVLTDHYFWNAVVNTLAMFVLATVPQLLAALALVIRWIVDARGERWFRQGPQDPARCLQPAGQGWLHAPGFPACQCQGRTACLRNPDPQPG